MRSSCGMSSGKLWRAKSENDWHGAPVALHCRHAAPPTLRVALAVVAGAALWIAQSPRPATQAAPTTAPLPELAPVEAVDLLSLMTLPAILRHCTTPLLLELAGKPPASERNYAGRIRGIFRMTDRRFGTAAGDSLRLESLRQVETLHAKLAKYARRHGRNDGDDRE